MELGWVNIDSYSDCFDIDFIKILGDILSYVRMFTDVINVRVKAYMAQVFVSRKIKNLGTRSDIVR